MRRKRSQNDSGGGLGDALGGPGKLRGDVCRLWRRFLVFRGCLREALGSSRGAPGSVLGCFGEVWGRLLGRLARSEGASGVNVEVIELPRF